MASTSGINEAKRVLRKELKRRLAKLSDETKTKESQVIAEKLFSMKEYRCSERISLYLSMPNEVSTMDILKNIFSSNKKCFIPQYIGPVMKMVRLLSMEDYDALPMTSWNIKQPADNDVRDDALESGGLDLIIVPGLGFTREGARLGRGKGYYDNYISKCGKLGLKPPITIALAYSVQMCDVIPVTSHDRYIDHVLYPD